VKTLSKLCWIFDLILIIGCSNPASQKETEELQKSIELQDYDENSKITGSPNYVDLQKSGELKKRGEELWQRMYNCDLCPQKCNANRITGERGICGANSDLEIAAYGAHFGEEPAFVGTGGTGRIFFTHCPLRCVYCINAKVSQEGYGEKYKIEDLADMMLALQNDACENICLVTPTQYTPHILLALDIAIEKGLRLPIIYNTSAYENPEILKYFDGIVDIYLTDLKFGCNKTAGKFTANAYNYVDSAFCSLIEMQKQVGKAKLDSSTGLWTKGLIIRHLVMPNNVSCSEEIIRWISENLPKDTYLTIMPNYEPLYKAKKYPDIDRRTNIDEYNEVLNFAKQYGLTNFH
jgi:putative pyruvate formate lyase activating enzyme